MNVGQMLSKHLIAAVLLVAICLLGTGIYFITKEKPEAQPLPTQLTVVPSESTISGDNFVTLTATLTSNGAPVEGENISWSVPPLAYVIPNPSITDSYGRSSVRFKTMWPLSIPPWENATPFTIAASFAGSNRYQGSTENASVVVIWYPS